MFIQSNSLCFSYIPSDENASFHFICFLLCFFLDKILQT
ncbi:hypothetical protein GPAL_3241 [Glaciecola pallidula DSM 14239 = ACAM 615]|uniref:Uncharacterized protein n=1 Tax=Brumicola pallidula DSM 14239 = ACAM 615 TaxID=1121922 RepID=K6ZIB1_9ALTE|nr:hypothetical protein GPAL_3241 [Glaciecola pallidula DSM 14239 = ACAM 615]